MYDQYDAQAAWEDMPGIQAVTVFRRSGSDTFDSGTAYPHARKKPPSLQLLIMTDLVNTRGVFTWQIFDPTANVNPGDQIMDASGLRYQVSDRVNPRLLNSVWDCLCIANR